MNMVVSKFDPRHHGFRPSPEMTEEGDYLASASRFPHMRRGSRADGALANPVRSGRKQP